MLFDIEEELKKLPSQPGVYIMHDAKDEIIYVGKAISLKNRVGRHHELWRAGHDAGCPRRSSLASLRGLELAFAP